MDSTPSFEYRIKTLEDKIQKAKVNSEQEKKLLIELINEKVKYIESLS